MVRRFISFVKTRNGKIVVAAAVVGLAMWSFISRSELASNISTTANALRRPYRRAFFPVFSQLCRPVASLYFS